MTESLILAIKMATSNCIPVVQNGKNKQTDGCSLRAHQCGAVHFGGELVNL